MAISPKISIYINIIVAILAAIVSGTVSLSGLVPDPVSHAIVTWSAFFLSIYGVVNAALHSVSSSAEGPLTNMQIKLEKIPPQLMIALLCLWIFAGLVISNSNATLAASEVKHKIIHSHKAPVTQPEAGEEDRQAPIDKPAVGEISDVPFEPFGFVNAVELSPAEPEAESEPESKTSAISWDAPVPTDKLRFLNTAVGASPKGANAIETLWAKLQALTLEDLQYANNLANSNQDTVSSTCYGALITLLQKNQTANIDPATGKPMTLPNVHLVTDLENVIIIYRELQPTSGTSVACAPLMNALKVSSMSALLTGLSGAAALTGGLTLP